MSVEELNDFLNLLAVAVHLKRLRNKRRSQLIDLIVLVFIYPVAYRDKSTVVLAFERIFCHASNYFLAQFC